MLVPAPRLDLAHTEGTQAQFGFLQLGQYGDRPASFARRRASCLPARMLLQSGAHGERFSGQKMNRVLMNFDLCPSTIVSSNALLASVCLVATIERIENARKASVTDSVPSAESLRPANGKTSGPRWHWQLMLTRQTWLTSGSTSAPICPGLEPKTLTC